ncbi:hypothetical protein [Nocardia suismassiliense]|uniref:hypothetical protein n=1 Tax=Nocardia suismassiliense TaxID=2077092 RepID=UPI0018FEAD62|nr:hypothetical protein [Nocardia suismassiliense]
MNPTDLTLSAALPSLGTWPGIADGLSPNEPPAKVVLSYGLGVDSSALLLRWIHDPSCRDFELDDLAVVVAMVGSEWDQTISDVTEVILPVLAEHGIRFIQAGRGRSRAGNDGSGVVIFADSRTPHGLHAAGAYTLLTEMHSAATVPQTGGRRACSISSKGEVLDPVIAAITHGLPFRHAMGYEAAELSRARKDAKENTATRRGEYPLIEWGWTRETAQQYLRETTGREFRKSACTFCPFALSTQRGRDATFAEYAKNPDAAATALLMERTAISLNPRQGLIRGQRLSDHLRAAGLGAIVDRFEQALADEPHALYELRRGARPTKKNPAKTKPARSVRAIDVGSVEEMNAWLTGEPLQVKVGLDAYGEPVLAPTATVLGEDGIARAYVAERDRTGAHQLEHFFVVAPAHVQDKVTDAGFGAWWEMVTHTDMSLFTPPDLLATVSTRTESTPAGTGAARFDAPAVGFPDIDIDVATAGTAIGAS